MGGFRASSNQRSVAVRGGGGHLDAPHAPFVEAAAMVGTALG